MFLLGNLAKMQEPSNFVKCDVITQNEPELAKSHFEIQSIEKNF